MAEQCWNPLLSQLLSVNRIQLHVWAFLELALLLPNDFISFWHFYKKICLKTFFVGKYFDPVNAFGPNTFQPCRCFPAGFLFQISKESESEDRKIRHCIYLHNKQALKKVIYRLKYCMDWARFLLSTGPQLRNKCFLRNT